MNRGADFEGLYACYELVCDESGLSPLPREQVQALLQWMAIDASTLVWPPASDTSGVSRH